ncbi:HEPN/Toprim-associated domain-containing protein [Rhizobium leguminosarum]|uniref:HEPN/Toprim-associated domain-containing protein n=1 Tax=Rhizobium leguminosarum TaxID=384 RepID=UPI001AE96246|nr:HEPN/Toprim-associated domain-containing protein [Rhizobium leguminosarum]MBP2444025.1 hypothetical protein [Rhizobium leguminosarum]
MGTYISLDVGAIEIAWSKNHPGLDHSCLFHETDRVEIRHDWSGEDDCQMGFRSTVAAVLPRIELLGHTLDRARREYETAVTINSRERLEYAEAVGEPAPSTDYLAFDEILTIAKSIPAKGLSKEIDEKDQEPKRVLVT